MLWKINDKFINTLNIFLKMIEEALKAVGLSDKEMKVYLSTLKLGASLVQEISKHAGLNRTSTYDLLKNMELKGFVSYNLESGKRYYTATSPQQLVQLLKEKEELVRKALPDLNKLKESVGEPPRIETYVGKQGLKSIFEDILKENKNFYGIGSRIHIEKIMGFYLPHFVERRKKQGMKVKLILDAIPIDITANYKVLNKKHKTLIYMYGDKISMMSFEKEYPIGLIIKDKNFVKTLKIMFEYLWDGL
jgi:sugar-specific transcriptional regulator TrmB